jgi:hypothetical protein
MLAGARFSLLILGCVFAVSASVIAQTNQGNTTGVPPSVTSLGFGGSTGPRGVLPSVTSLPKNNAGYSGSAFGAYNLFLPSYPDPTWQHHKGKDKKDKSKKPPDNGALVGVLEPAYIPVAVPYADQGDADDDADDNSPQASTAQDFDPGLQDPAMPRRRTSHRVPEADAEDPGQPEQPDMQPSTVLVFKDGHQSDVLNYAIVGDTLFDFADGRTKKILLADLDLPATRKANDDRGVDFQLPVVANAKDSSQ